MCFGMIINNHLTVLELTKIGLKVSTKLSADCFAIWCHRDIKCINILESKLLKTGTSDRAINQIEPCWPNLKNLSQAAKISISSWFASTATAAPLAATFPIIYSHAYLLWICFLCVRSLQVRTPDVCIRWTSFTLINGLQLQRLASCSRPDSSDK